MLQWLIEKYSKDTSIMIILEDGAINHQVKLKSWEYKQFSNNNHLTLYCESDGKYHNIYENEIQDLTLGEEILITL